MRAPQSSSGEQLPALPLACRSRSKSTTDGVGCSTGSALGVRNSMNSGYCSRNLMSIFARRYPNLLATWQYLEVAPLRRSEQPGLLQIGFGPCHTIRKLRLAATRKKLVTV